MADQEPPGKPEAPKKSGSARSAKGAGAARKESAGRAGGRGDVRRKVVDAALALAAERPWDEVTFQEIAARAGVPLADMVEAFATRLSVVRAFMRRIDREVVERLDPELAQEPARERLFDVLIGRFEALNPHKAAVRSLWRSLSRDPDALLVLNRSAIRSQLAMMAAAGIDAEGLSGIVRAQGLAMIFYRTMTVWLDDDDPGMARTMAALDRHLRDAERLLRPLEGLGMAARIAGSFCSALLGRRGGGRGGRRGGEETP